MERRYTAQIASTALGDDGWARRLYEEYTSYAEPRPGLASTAPHGAQPPPMGSGQATRMSCLRAAALAGPRMSSPEMRHHLPSSARSAVLSSSVGFFLR